jgi:hypothetical protein
MLDGGVFVGFRFRRMDPIRGFAALSLDSSHPDQLAVALMVRIENWAALQSTGSTWEQNPDFRGTFFNHYRLRAAEN